MAKTEEVKKEEVKKEEKVKEEEAPYITLEVRDGTDSIVAGYKVRYDPNAGSRDLNWQLTSASGTAFNTVDPNTPVVILRVPAFMEAMKDFDVQKQKDERDEAQAAANVISAAPAETPKEEEVKTNG